MDPTTRALMSTAGAVAGPATYVEDVFSTWLYTGNGSTQTITNGIDLAGKGGLVWIKSRGPTAYNHCLIDSVRGITNGNILYANTTNANQTDSAAGLSALNSSGFTLNTDSNGYGTNYAAAGDKYASWTFRKAPKFFDVVTGTADSSGNVSFSHNLGSTPGCVIIKSTTNSSSWFVYHTSLGTSQSILLNSTLAAQNQGAGFVTVSSTSFSMNIGFGAGAVGYVAYLFAHDAGGFGDSGNDSVVKCGSFVEPSSGTLSVDLGWEPQYLMIKPTNISGSWYIFDNMRTLNYSSNNFLLANSSDAENSGSTAYVVPTSTGFTFKSNFLGSGTDYIYIAIRRGPMKTPTDATKIFAATTSSASAGTKISTSFPVDMQIAFERDNSLSIACGAVNDRLRGVSSTSTQTITNLLTHSNAAEGTSGTGSRNWDNTGFEMPNYPSTLSNIFWNFRRAPGFFDVAAYTGDGGSSSSYSHALGVSPDLLIIKRRNASSSDGWFVYSPLIGGTANQLLLNSTASNTTYGARITGATATTFTVNNNGSDVNGSGSTYIAYLFASCPGVSKVGSYTGTGTTLQINCGFTAGARFVLIKRTDSTGDWYVWDTARGIVSGNDPFLLVNSTAAENTSTDYIDPLSSGFEISSSAPAAINASGGTFLYLAIA